MIESSYTENKSGSSTADQKNNNVVVAVESAASDLSSSPNKTFDEFCQQKAIN